MARRRLVAVLALCLLADGFCYPHARPQTRATDDSEQTQVTDAEVQQRTTSTTAQEAPTDNRPEVSNEVLPPLPSDDDDDDDFESLNTSSSGDGGGSNIFSLLRIAGAILPSSSNAGILLRNIIRQLVRLNQPTVIQRRFISDNEINIDYIDNLKLPQFQKQEDESADERENNSRSESNESGDTAAEESVEDLNENNAKENSDSNKASVSDDDSDYDSDEPPGGGDGQGGGILGLLAGLSGGEDGQSDLGSLLATVSGIIANLSGDGIDLNALIASGIGLFVGLLSEGEENPGAVIASYLLTSLDTITGGGSKNNGAFFGTFLSKLVKGTSAAGNSGESSEENGDKTKMSDSAGFFVSLLTSLLGEMSKGSSGGSHPW